MDDGISNLGYYSLTALSISAALSMYWDITKRCSLFRMVAKWMIAIGWSMLSLRLVAHFMLESVTVVIHPASLVALTLIATGTVLLNMRNSSLIT